ncbi:MAG: MG2 domain-containing protein, partial [Alphaproteobacteria bacterium]
LQAVRRAELDFVPRARLDQADQLGGELARRGPVNGDASGLVASGNVALRANDPRRAAELFRDALAINPTRFDYWSALAQAVFAIQTNDWKEQRALARQRVAIAINGYLRAPSVVARARALNRLGRAFVESSVWRPAIRSYRASLQLREDSGTRAIYDQTVAEHGFRLLEHRVDAEVAAPQICLVFSDDLATDNLDVKDFVRVEAAPTLAINVSAREVCVDGVEHGGRYGIQVLAGLPAADGEAIERSIALDIYVRDRQPSVRFPGIAYVLPGHDDGAIPVATVNTSAIDVSLYRVGDRALARTIGDGQFLNQLSVYQGERLAEQTGELVWEGSVEVEQLLNTEVINTIPVRDITTEIKPGAYVLVAMAASGGQSPWQAQATQWFIATDLGLTTASGADGFRVQVRSLTTAEPVAGVQLRLVAVNNQILATGLSDEAGWARFDAGLVRGHGGLAPALLVAETEGVAGDYSFLDLTRSEIDLTDRGVAGREPPGPIDVYLTTERGIYRPGEVVFATALVRDAVANAIDEIPLTLIVHRPDGKEAERRLIEDHGAGGSVTDIAIATDAMRGAWRIGLYADPKSAALAEAAYLVEDFLPERLDFELAVDADRVEPAEPFAVIVDARFLYGAPASNLTVAGLASLIAVRELDAFPGYLFGLADEETSPTRIAFNEQTTDEDGRARLDVTLPKTALMTRPQQAVITTQVFDAGGRPVERSQTLAVTDTHNRLGLKARFDSPVTENSSAGFDVIAVDPATERVDLATADWVLSRVETEFQWFRSNGRWNYRPLHRKRRIATGTVTMTAGQSGRIDVEVAWGAYELSVAAGAGVLPVSHRFEAGWRAAASAIETPEMLQLTLDKSSYAVGDTVAVQITAPFAGRGEVLVVDNRLIERVSVDVTTAGATVDLLVTEDWGPGAYVLASVYRPMNLTAKRMPARAMGLAWASVDPGDRVIAMSLATPESARPRQSLPVTITLPDHAADREIYLTLAAVDAGILNLTGHQPPDPRGWYFGQRRLGVSIRDFYNQLIDRTIGSAGVVRSGGDASIMSFDGPPPPETLMAFHSGVVPVDSDGRVTIDVPVPDFSGTVRLMAMAWSAAGVGHAVMDVVVRDPVVVTTSMPRFLAPGDRSRVLIDIDNVEKLSGEARLIVSATGDGGLSVPAVDAIQTVRLDGAGRSRHLVPITAHFTGMAGLSVELELPDGSVL